MQAATVFAYLLISSVLASTEPEEEISEPAREEPQKKPMPADPGSNPSIGSNIGSNQGPSSSESGYFTQNSGTAPSSASTNALDSRNEPPIPQNISSEEPTSNGDLPTPAPIEEPEDVQSGSDQPTSSNYDHFMDVDFPPYYRSGTSTATAPVLHSAVPTLEGVPDLDEGFARCEGFNHSSGSFSAPWSTKDSDSLPSAGGSSSLDRSAEMDSSAQQHHRTTAEESGLNANPAQPGNQPSSFNPLPPELEPSNSTAVEDIYQRVHNTDTGYPSTSDAQNPISNPVQTREADQPTTSRDLTWTPNENINFPNYASKSGWYHQNSSYEQAWQDPDLDENQPSTSSGYRGNGNHPTHFCQPRWNPELFPAFDGYEFDQNLQDADVEEEANDRNDPLRLVESRLNDFGIPTDEEFDVSGILQPQQQPQAQAPPQLPDANNGPNAPNADNNNGRRWLLVEFLFRSALNPQHQDWIQWTGDGSEGNELQFTLNHLQAARQWNLYRGKGKSKDPGRDFARQMRNFYGKTLELTGTAAHTYRFLSFFDHDFVRLLALIAALRQSYTNPMQLKKTNGSNKKKRDDGKK